jgi:hypothetical protein
MVSGRGRIDKPTGSGRLLARGHWHVQLNPWLRFLRTATLSDPDAFNDSDVQIPAERTVAGPSSRS